MARRILNSVIISLFLLSMIGYSLYSLDNSTSNIKIELIDGSDVGRINRINHLTIRVYNHEDVPLYPVFFASFGEGQLVGYWRILQGKEILYPGESSVYMLYNPAAKTAIPPYADFRIFVNDKKNPNFRATSPVYSLPEDFVGIQNPELAFWVYDMDVASTHPFAWDRSKHVEGGERAVFERDGNDSIKLGIENMTRRTGNWAMSGLQQMVDLPGKLEVRVKPEFSTPVSYNPPHAFGFEIADEYKRVWIVFSEQIKDPVLLERTSGNLQYALVFLPTETGRWITHTVNILEIYLEMGWTFPNKVRVVREGVSYEIRQVNLLGFMAIYPGSEKTSGYGYIDYARNS